jgi:hypothetical protein
MFSRAFLNFNSPEAVYEFKARFDGHVFVSTRGTQYRCSVEYAPFQKVPTAHPKKLAMEGTIDKGALTGLSVSSIYSHMRSLQQQWLHPPALSAIHCLVGA